MEFKGTWAINNCHLNSLFLIKSVHLWWPSGAATGRPHHAFLNQVQARRHRRQAEMWDLERIRVWLPSLSQGRGSRWRDWWILPVGALEQRRPKMLGFEAKSVCLSVLKEDLWFQERVCHWTSVQINSVYSD